MNEAINRRLVGTVSIRRPLQWGDIATTPPSRLRARIARSLVERGAARQPMAVVLPDGRNLGAATAPELRIRRPEAFYSRLGQGGLVGFGEAYMAGDWDTDKDELVEVLTILASRVTSLIPPRLQRLRSLAVPKLPGNAINTRRNARNNIAHHYDLSNEFFASFLDPTMTYSAALFGEGVADPSRIAASDLGTAQRRKIDRLLDGTGVGAGTNLLEIGTGWGELAVRAARRGATVTSITLSEAQRDLARERVAAAGVSHLVDIELRDYREQRGQYDSVISVEMIEAVGREYWPTYFTALDRLVRPGGRVGLQAITLAHDRMLATSNTYTWVQKYIFPGGAIPSTTAIEEAVRQCTHLEVVDRLSMGSHYAETLRLWHQRFDEAFPRMRALGLDTTFERMWRFYLSYSEAGFRSRYLDVHQYLMESRRG